MPAENSKSASFPRVAVLIPTYNRPDLLGRAIESVLKQQHQDWNLYVINDGGVEVSQIVQGFGDPRLHYLPAPHKGKAATLNLGIRSSQSEFIAYLDDDDILYPNHLKLLVKALEENPQAVMAYSDTLLVHLRKAEGEWKESKREIINTRQVTLEMQLEANNVTQNILQRRRVLERTGLYDEQLEVLIDWDMMLRLFAAGPVAYVPEVTSEYYQKLDESDNVINAITGLYYQDRPRYYANRCYILSKMVYLPLIAQGVRPPEGDAAEDEVQKIARLVQKRLAQALPIAGSKEEVDNLRKACREQWEALARFRANPLYKVYRAIKSMVARPRKSNGK